MAIRGKSIQYIRANLRAFCAEANFFGQRTYILLKNGRSVPLRDLFTKWEAIRNFYKSLRRGYPSFIRIRLPDARIRIKNNARLIYRDIKSGRTLTAKIALRSAVTTGCLAREIRARKFLARKNISIPVPILVRYDSPRMRWMEEEYIEADERASNAQKSELFLVHHALSLYAPMVRSRPLQNSLRRFHVSWSELQDIFAEAGTETPDAAKEGAWPISLIHGDLSTGNMMVGSDGRLFVIDWEKCKTGPVAWDLKKLFLSDDLLVCELLRALSRPDDLEPTSQMHVAIAMELAQRRRDYKRKLAQHIDQGKERDFAMRLISAREKNLLAAIGGRPVASLFRKREPVPEICTGR